MLSYLFFALRTYGSQTSSSSNSFTFLDIHSEVSPKLPARSLPMRSQYPAFWQKGFLYFLFGHFSERKKVLDGKWEKVQLILFSLVIQTFLPQIIIWNTCIKYSIGIFGQAKKNPWRFTSNFYSSNELVFQLAKNANCLLFRLSTSFFSKITN